MQYHLLGIQYITSVKQSLHFKINKQFLFNFISFKVFGNVLKPLQRGSKQKVDGNKKNEKKFDIMWDSALYPILVAISLIDLFHL